MKIYNSNNAKISLKKMRTIFILSTFFTAFFIDQERVGAEISQSLNSKTLKPRAEDWLLYGRTYDDQRFSTLTQINTETVSDLKPQWVADVDSPDGLSATPIVSQGIIYLSGSFTKVFAYDGETGKMIWNFDPQVTLDKGFSNSWSARINRGVALWNGVVYVGTGDCRLIALNAKTGKRIWETVTCDPAKGYGITGAPRVANGKVFIGNLGSDTATRGYVSAYDARSGRLAWRFYTTPGDPKLGFENKAMEMAAKTWTGQGWWNGSGGNVWNSISYDPEFNQLYIGTAASEPKDPSVRSPDGGDNLFTNSIVALDADTGEYKWHYQETPRDAWDYNSTADIIQAELVIDGKPRKVLLHAPKNGFFYVLDRKSGKLISADKFATVTWAEKVDLDTGRPVYNKGSFYFSNPSSVAYVYPHGQGAHNWHPMSYSPATGLAYIPVQDFPAIYSKNIPNLNWGTYPFDPDNKEMIKGVGRLVAWDPVAKSPRWIVPHDLPINGGTLATAGNLVFQGTATGMVQAFTADTGKILWASKIGSSVQAGPITYMIKGKQYLLVPAGASGQARLVFPRYGASPDAHGPSRLVAYVLGGTGTVPRNDNEIAKEVPPPPPQTASAANIRWGKSLFMTKACLGCHGAEAVQDSRGSVPDLRYLPPEKHALWNEIVRGGLLKINGMPAHADSVTEEEASAIHAYIIDLQTKLYFAQHKDGQ